MPTRTAIFPGTFNPFTIGHLSIVQRACALFDHIIVALGYNEHKDSSDVHSTLNELKSLFAGNNQVSVEAYTGLTVNFARQIGACAIIRGVRNVADFEYERNMADANRLLSGIETIVLYSEPQLSCISSSMVRELIHNNVDVTPFLPNKNL